MNYAAQAYSIHCATVDLSKAYDRFNIDRLIRELRCSDSPDKIVDIIEFIAKNTMVNVLFNGCLGTDWPVGNGARQGGICPVCYLIVILTE